MQAEFESPPPLKALQPALERILPSATKAGSQDQPFAVGADTDFIALSHRIELLSRILTDIPSYGAHERQAVQTEQELYKLDAIEKSLKRLHALIREFLFSKADLMLISELHS